MTSIFAEFHFWEVKVKVQSQKCFTEKNLQIQIARMVQNTFSQK